MTETIKQAKLTQYLSEAYGKEKELETALEAHIAMTTRDSYRKRLRDHLSETKRHAREVESRIRKLGGALFCDRRYGRVFVYHNGAQSYYAARGYRGLLRV